MRMSQYRLAQRLNVPPRRINEIVRGQRAISADTAQRLSRLFGTSERFWMNLQVRYDLEVQKDRLGKRLQKSVLYWIDDLLSVQPARLARREQPISSRPASGCLRGWS
jgi:addiction module HigA family antidote